MKYDLHDPVQKSSARPRSWKLILAGWLPAATTILVGAIGGSRLFDPFSGDQALFLEGAKQLHAGGALYRDYWDIKQPAIFEFFLVAGNLFGFTQVGIHALELIWQVSFAVILVIALRHAFKNSNWVFVAPLSVVGAEYAGSSPWHLLQVEELVGLPIFICIWAVINAQRSVSMTAGVFTSGIAAGIVLLFKLVLAPIVFATTVAGFLTGEAKARVGAAQFWRVWVLGMVIPLVSYMVFSASTRSLNVTLETALSIPFQIARYAPHAPLSRLTDSALRLLLYFRGIIVLAVIGLCTMRDKDQRQWRIACSCWIACGVAVIVLQMQSWWQYQFLLIVPPLGILAAFGASFLAKRVERRGIRRLVALAASAAVAYIAVPLPQGAIGTILQVFKERPFASVSALTRYQCTVSSEYYSAVSEAKPFLNSADDSGSIYVFGNPLVYVVTGKLQPVAMTNWSSYLDPPFIWSMLDAELSEARPQHIYVADSRKSDVSSARSPKTSSLLRHSYYITVKTALGTWYQRR